MDSVVRIADLAEAERPRERLADRGEGSLTAAELLAILLRTGRQGASAIDIGKALMARFVDLDGIAKASLDDLQTVSGVGPDKAVTIKAALEIARRFAEGKRQERPVIDHPMAVVELLRSEVGASNVERLQVLLLNTRRRLIRVESVSEGLLDQILIHPREVFRPAIGANAHAVILVHNHPSGDPTPSEADIRVTRDLIRAGRLLKIEVLDHIIIGRAGETHREYTSLKELGYFHE
ncbi:MAG TPA: DNA repair protein RadC [Candidatus Limnocylindria bacterium]|jgi:DNA repair protein RadC|nr:DNA repair protein RadC [Candidatus Limnocylindria bacterium]